MTLTRLEPPRLLLVTLALVACRGEREPRPDESTPPPTTPEAPADSGPRHASPEYLAFFAAASEQMCACRDRQCAYAVEGNRRDWAATNTEWARDVKLTPDEMDEFDRIIQRHDRCETRVLGRSERDEIRGVSTGVSECDAYLANYEALRKCEKVAGALDRLGEDLNLAAIRKAWREWADLEGDALRAAHRDMAPVCEAAIQALRQHADELGCEWPYLK